MRESDQIENREELWFQQSTSQMKEKRYHFAAFSLIRRVLLTEDYMDETFFGILNSLFIKSLQKKKNL